MSAFIGFVLGVTAFFLALALAVSIVVGVVTVGAWFVCEAIERALDVEGEGE